MAKGITHYIEDGICSVCGDTADWLISRGESVSTLDSWQVVDPAGTVHTKKRGARQYTHALIRQNKGDEGTGHYFVNWATSEANAYKESRVLRDSRSYIEIVKLSDLPDPS